MKESVNKYFSSIKARSAIEPERMYTKFPKLACVPQELAMDYTRILNKPYYITTVPWTTSQIKGTELFKTFGGDFVDGFNVPSSLFLSTLAKLPFFASVFYRCKIRLTIQIAGTPMHQGCVLFAAQPVGFRIDGAPAPVPNSDVNSLMAGPHVFAFANESTAVSLEVPFYFNTKLGKCDLDQLTIQPNFSFGNYAQVLAVVLNPLEGPAGSSTSLSFSVHAEYEDMEFYIPHTDPTYEPVPTLIAQGFVSGVQGAASSFLDTTFNVARNTASDILDVTRSLITRYTGLDANNYPNIQTKDHVVARQMPNIVDMPKQFEKMDPYGEYDRICSDYIFDTERDEMLMREVINKPQLIGTFRVNASDPTGTICWARPMSPVSQQTPYVYTNTAGEVITTKGWDNLFQTMYYLTRFWKGSIKIHIQSVMSNFHYCKLLVARDYSLRKNGLNQYPNLQSIPNLMTDTLEFSAGGQVQTIILPYAAPTDVLPNTLDHTLMASQMGMYYVYLAQPLVVNGSVVSDVSFNVYISAGDDFNFYGYSTNPMRLFLSHSVVQTPALAEEEEALIDLEAQGEIVDDSKVPEPVGLQKSVTFNPSDKSVPFDTGIMRPIVSLRDMFRRMYLTNKINLDNDALTAAGGLILIDVAEELGIRPAKINIGATQLHVAASTLRVLQHMFHGYAGGARFKLLVEGSSNANAWYIPPGFQLQGNTGGSTGFFNWASTVPTSNASAQIGLSGREIFSITRLGLGDPEMSAQTVIQECPNLAVNSFAAVAAYTATNENAASYCLLEGEVPNMSPYRFVGDYVSKCAPFTRVLATTPTTNLGFIVLFVPQQFRTDGTNRKGGVSLSVFAAADDTARAGYQVHSPQVYLPAAIVGGGAPQPNFTAIGVDHSVLGTGLVDVNNQNAMIFYTKTT